MVFAIGIRTGAGRSVGEGMRNTLLKVRLHNNVGNIPANLPWFFLACNCAICFKRAWMALQPLQQFGLTRYQNFFFDSTRITFRDTAIWKLIQHRKSSNFHTMSQYFLTNCKYLRIPFAFCTVIQAKSDSCCRKQFSNCCISKSYTSWVKQKVLVTCQTITLKEL